MICQIKPSKYLLTINNLLDDVLFRQTFFHQILKKSQFAKLSHHMVFLCHHLAIIPVNFTVSANDVYNTANDVYNSFKIMFNS